MISFASLSTVDTADLQALFADPDVRRHMPLTDEEPWSADDVHEWVARKESITEEHGYGPQAIIVDGTFAGWGGIEPDGEGASISLVLLPSFWGHGREILEVILEQAFVQRGLPYVLVEFPPSRTRVRGLLRMGFHQFEERTIEGERFIVYRLDAPA
jgi:ribosomal-protein-alanine N-acetyltransferase